MIQGYYFIWPLSFVISCRSAYRAICNGRTAHPQARWNIGGNDKRYWPDKIMDYSTTHSLSIHNKQLQKNTPIIFVTSVSLSAYNLGMMKHFYRIHKNKNLLKFASVWRYPIRNVFNELPISSWFTPCINNIKHFYCEGCWFKDLYISPLTTLFLVQELFVNMDKKLL